MDLDEYYLEHYSKVQRSGVQGLGNRLMDKTLAKIIKKSYQGGSVLELGAASGEFTQFLFDRMTFDSYTALDLEPGRGNPKLKQQLIDTYTTFEFI